MQDLGNQQHLIKPQYFKGNYSCPFLILDFAVDVDSLLLEDQYTTEHKDPSTVREVHYVYMHIECDQTPERDVLGKWLIFKHFDEIDATWAKIRTAMIEDKLQGCKEAKCSTMRYNPSSCGPGPDTTAVICVYTEEHNMDDVGFKVRGTVRVHNSVMFVTTIKAVAGRGGGGGVSWL